MAAVPIQIDGVLYDHASKSARKVTLMGDAFIQGVTVGGGPIVPPDTGPPGYPEHPIYHPDHPAHPIVIPPTPPSVSPPRPEHPIYLPPVPEHPIVIPPPSEGTPPAAPPEGWSWQWLAQSSQWVLVYNPPGGGKPQPPGPGGPDQPPAVP